MRALLPTLALTLLPLPAIAQPICLPPDARAPFVDGEVLSCGPDLPRLTVVRESALYDPELGEWRQAILLRFANPFEDELIVSGVVDLDGVELIGEPAYLGADLRRGDFEWAVAPLSHYQDPGDCSALVEPPGPHPGRGIEFGDLLRYGPDSVRFEFAAAADLDDVRLIVSAPDPVPAGAVHITLFDVLTSPGVEVQVGAVDVDVVPDDGLYPGVGTVTARLRALDLEVVEDCVSGPVDDGFPFELVVPDVPPERPAARDPRADFNGDLDPVDALGAPVALRWRPTSLESDAGDTLLVAALDGLDLAICADGQASLPLELFVEPADGLPDGLYVGTVDVWEDTNDNRRFDRAEIGDTVRIVAVVGPEPDVDPCSVVPDPDAGLPGDAGLDGGLDAGLDLDAAASVDAGPLDGALDGAADGALALDARVDPVDGGSDAALSADATADEGFAGDGGLADSGGDVSSGDGARTDFGAVDGAVDAAMLDAAVSDLGSADAGAADGALDGRDSLDEGTATDAGADGQLADAAFDGAGLDGASTDAADGQTASDGALDGGGDGALDSSPDDGFDAAPVRPEAGPSDAGADAADGGPDSGVEPDAAVDADTLQDAQPDAADDPGDPQGGALSCRATPGAPAGLGWLALGVLILLARRRRAVSGLVLLGLALIGPGDLGEARAQADVRRFSPTPTLSPYVNLDGSGTLGSGRVGARLLSVVEQRPLVFARDGDRTLDIVSIRLGIDAALAVGLTNWLDVGVGLPFVLLQDGRQVAADASLASTALADPSLGAKLRLMPTTDGVGLALRVGATLPLGDPQALTGEPGATGSAVLVLELPLSSRFDIVLDGGYRLREETRLGDIALDDELLFGLGASWRATPDFALALEFGGATGASDPFGVEQQTPGELDLMARVRIADGLAAVAGAGMGLLPGYGSPMFRAVLGLQFAPRNHDFDGDGLADSRDDCIETPGVALERGCPAPARAVAATEEQAPSRDQDRDDIIDALDQCPYLPEDRDGFRDDDGCPDADNDLDLLADGFDADPLGPEDWDGFDDGDGIPDPDNDRDGVADARDRCPLEKGGADGCPASLLPESPTAGGDGLAEGVGADAPLVLGRTLHPARPIIFEFARPELSAEAEPLVDGLAGYLIDHPELDRVEVGVHVDAMGSRRWKHWLSRARAEAVVQALIERGVPATRIFPRGYGPEVPVDSNRTKAGRFNNRRVELRALRAFEEARPTQAQPQQRQKTRRTAPKPRPDGLPAPRPRWLPPDTLVLRPTAPLAFVRGDALAPRSAPRILELGARLKSNPAWTRVEVAVHTDGAGDPDEKLRASQRRARAVVEALVETGIERARLVPRGYGARRRLTGDGTAADRAVNRRVELVVLDDSVSLAPEDAR